MTSAEVLNQVLTSMSFIQRHHDTIENCYSDVSKEKQHIQKLLEDAVKGGTLKPRHSYVVGDQTIKLNEFEHKRIGSDGSRKYEYSVEVTPLG